MKRAMVERLVKEWETGATDGRKWRLSIENVVMEKIRKEKRKKIRITKFLANMRVAFIHSNDRDLS